MVPRNRNAAARGARIRIATLLALASALLALTALCGCAGGALEDKVAEQRSEFHNLNVLEAQTLDGETFSEADFEPYDATIINIWATWCPYCIEEMPNLAAYAKGLPGNVNFITICTDGAGNEDVVSEILSDAGYDGVTLVSGEYDYAELLRQGMPLPTTIVVDNRGTTCTQYIMGSPRGKVREYYDMLLGAALEEFGV